MLGAPHPRYRLYTRSRSYRWLLRDVLTGRLHRGGEVEELERELAEWLQVPHVVCMPYARTGMYLTLKALIRPGQRVIIQPYTIVDAVNMVLCAGGVPVFADIEPETCSLDPADVERLIDKDTGAVCVTHLHGIPGAIEELTALCARRGIPLIEDTAQAFGARIGGRRLGTFGTAGVYSFGTYKNICAWYGGAVVTEDAALAARIRAARDGYALQTARALLARMRLGLSTDVLTLPAVFKTFTYWIFRFGILHDLDWINRRLDAERHTESFTRMPEEYLCRMTPSQARLLLAQLDHVDPDNAARIRAAELYHQGLADLGNRLVLPPRRNDGSHIYTYFPVQFTPRQDLIKSLQSQNRDLAQQYLHNCADLPSFAAYRRDCPRARKTSASTILLPTYPRYPVAEIEKNIACIREYFARAGRMPSEPGARESVSPPAA